MPAIAIIQTSFHLLFNLIDNYKKSIIENYNKREVSKYNCSPSWENLDCSAAWNQTQTIRQSIEKCNWHKKYFDESKEDIHDMIKIFLVASN